MCIIPTTIPLAHLAMNAQEALRRKQAEDEARTIEGECIDITDQHRIDRPERPLVLVVPPSHPLAGEPGTIINREVPER